MNNVRQFVVCASIVFAVAACLTLVAAQEGFERGEEHERLGYFVGNWTNEGRINENTMGLPTGKFNGKDKCEWFEGKFAVVCHSEGTGPMGPTKQIGIMSYAAMEGVYTYYGNESTGMAMTTIPRGTVEGKSWVYNDESKMGDSMVKNRYVMDIKSDTTYTFKWEVEGSDGWATVMEGTVKKN